MLIGSAPQTGIFDKMLGRGNQPPPPPPPPPPMAQLKFGPLNITIPQQQYIVESSRATPQLLEQTLVAPPVERIERPYTLDEIRRSGRLRDKVRRIDVDTITFDTGQATVPDDQIPAMQSIGTAIRDLVRRDPTQVILIEGHTDAVGSDLANLALSDRRAETVAEILSYYFGVPPENLVTQGYGEQYLKIPTVGAERQNRRVAFRNITDLLRGSQ
jgi:outer membrane protein OmpA-like peptidoglycan-associated protein